MNILIADDHKIVFSGLRVMIASLFKEVDFTYVDNEQDLDKELGSDKEFNLIFLDVSMKDYDVFEAIQSIKNLNYRKKIIVFSMHSEVLYANKIKKAGAHAYLNKDATADEIRETVTKVLQGINVFKLVDNKVNDNSDSNPFLKLSKRELQITQLLLSGSTPAEIRDKINIEFSTISTYKMRIFKKLGIQNIIGLSELTKVYPI